MEGRSDATLYTEIVATSYGESGVRLQYAGYVHLTIIMIAYRLYSAPCLLYQTCIKTACAGDWS